MLLELGPLQLVQPVPRLVHPFEFQHLSSAVTRPLDRTLLPRDANQVDFYGFFIDGVVGVPGLELAAFYLVLRHWTYDLCAQRVAMIEFL